MESINIKTLLEIKKEIISSEKTYYVYLLFKPDGIPFYVGKGKSNRISAHEAETRYFLNGKKWKGMNDFKLNTISKIWGENGIVSYQIDSWHDESVDAGKREIDLVEQYGRRILETGPLTNILDGGDLMTEEDRKILGEKIRQHYIDHPEARDAVSKRFIQHYIDHPEARDHLSDVLKNYCIDHPEFIERLQDGKNEWIVNKPEEYAEVKRKIYENQQSQEHRDKVRVIMKEYYENNPEDADRLRKQGADYFKDNPEAVDNARQNAIKNNSIQNAFDWYNNPENALAREEKNKARSKWLLEWHSTEDGKEKTKQAAIKRNEKIRTEEHRSHMAKKTSEYMKNNPEADKARRDKITATNLRKHLARQSKLLKIQEDLYSCGKINIKREKITSNIFSKWKSKGLVNKNGDILNG